MSTLRDMLRSSSARYARRTALIFGSSRMSYRKLNEAANKLAHGLRDMGVKKGERIGVLLLNCPEFVISYFAIAKLGAVVVPLNNMFKTEELKYVLEDSEASTVITSSHFTEQVLNLRLRLEGLSNIVMTDKDLESAVSLNSIYQRYPTTEPEQGVGEGDLAAILYTSGTTGRPKGAMLTNKNLLSNALASAKAIKAGRKDNFICFLPMFHSFAYTACIMMPLTCGARVTIIESPRPFSNVIKSIMRNRVTIFVGVPSIYNILKDASLPRMFTSPLLKFLNPLRLCISGAAALPVETLKVFEGKMRLPLLEGYGLTEASPVVSINPIKGERKVGSIGLPLEGVDVAIGSEDGALLGRDEIGELLVKGPNVMKGYFKLPEDTDEALKSGWLWTGDMAKIDHDGYVYIVDRKKDMVNVRGLNVYPKEIEELLYQHPKIAEVAVIGVKDEHKGEVPKAFVALKEGNSMTQNEVVHYCREKIASFKVPKYVEFRDALPKNATGKILKKDLRAGERV